MHIYRPETALKHPGAEIPQLTILVFSPTSHYFALWSPDIFVVILRVFDGNLSPLQHDKKLLFYDCTCAGLTQRFVFIVVLRPTIVGGAKQHNICQILCVAFMKCMNVITRERSLNWKTINTHI